MNFLSEKYNEKLFRMKTIGDGSCFFHSICQSISPLYRKLSDNKKMKFVKEFRKQLSEKLLDTNGDVTWYESLGNGSYREFSKNCDEIKLKNMIDELNSDEYVSNIYNEFISEVLNINIFLLDQNNKDVYYTGDDNKLLYKKRNSIILIYIDEDSHYENVCLLEEKNLKTVFEWESKIIKKIKKRFNV